ncbi:MAG: ATP-binding protein [Methanosarcinaceae archaeon]|nr:ATP-binding protein [Methanosarcinaceae archaeon]
MKVIAESKTNPDASRPVDNTIMYNNGIEYLFEELHRIDLMMRIWLRECRSDHQGHMGDFRGLYVSEDEVNSILQTPLGGLQTDHLLAPEMENIEKIKEDINRKKNSSIKKGKELRLHTLSYIFNLHPFEVDVLLMCIAPELDTRYEKLYSYLQDDVTKKRPQVNLAINLLIPSMVERLKGRDYFSSNAPLIKNRLIHLTGSVNEERPSILSKSINVDERIIGYLLGSDEIDFGIRNFCKVVEAKSSISSLIADEDKKSTITELIKWQSYVNDPVIFYLQGAYGTGKKTTAEVICKELGKSLLIVDPMALAGEGSFEKLDLIMREALLQNSFLFFEGFDILLKDKESGFPFNELINTLDGFKDWVFLAGEHPWEPKKIFKDHRFINYTFELPDFPIRQKLWESLLISGYDYSRDVDITTLANKFNLSGGQIKDAIFTASNNAMVKNPGESELSMSDLYLGCKAQSNKNLATMAKKIEPHYTWNDITLPLDIKEQLKEISGHIEYKQTVYYEWGFERKLSLGKGLNVFFSGPSGTGKTMAAEIIAGELGLDLYKIDLSSVVSKYIGETEKNLNRVFKEAETSNAILFFDEADALFGKRSEVRDSHDRYANIETNYLLQKMEEHEGIVILASNFKKNIDEAFLRRLNFNIVFPFPDEKLRENIWRSIFPDRTPIADDIDFSFLANFKITGGNIKNIALSAAFLAAGDSHIITMEHIIRAVKREFQKMGKLCTPGEFGQYYELVK